MNGTLVNGLAIMLGSLGGIVLKTGFFKEKSQSIISALGLIILVIGLQGVINTKDLLVLIVSLALGVVVGEMVKLDDWMNRFGFWMESKFAKGHDGRFAEGFVTSTLLFGVGAMAIVGSLESGLHGNESILYTKSLLDFVSSVVFASSFGWGVFFSAIPIVLYQGVLTLLSVVLSTFLSEIVITDLSTMGSILIMALGTNMMGATRFKVANLLPSLLMIVLIRMALSLI